MRKIFKLEVSLWLLLSAALFAFVLPLTLVNVLALIACFALYLFGRNGTREETENEESVEGRISRAMARLAQVPRHSRNFVHNKADPDRRSSIDIRSYL